MKLSAVNTDVQRSLVQGWALTGQRLDELRRAELAKQSAEVSRQAAYDMLQLGGMLPGEPAREATSGLVEMQRLFMQVLGRESR